MIVPAQILLLTAKANLATYLSLPSCNVVMDIHWSANSWQVAGDKKGTTS